MEFVDNTGHIFSLPSYKEKPIGYEYDEYSYIFWIDSNNTSKLSVNNFYSKPIYALYELNEDFNIEELEDDYNKILDIEIYFDNSNVYKLISSKELQNLISQKDFKLTDYVNLNLFDNNEEQYNLLKSKLVNEDLYCIKTEEIKYANEQDIIGTSINYLMIPIYPIAMSKDAGTWITNLMIHIHNNSNNTDEWCYISIGGEFIDEYEELIINGRNMGVSLPKDILKSIYQESLYNDTYNEALFNKKIKEYMLNYMNIKGETGNFKSAINSLKWFGYGNKITVSKLLRTDNQFKEQFVLDYFNISYDILESYKAFVANAFISLMIMINKETDEQYPFDNADIKTLYNGFLGENKPKMLSLIDYYEKIKIGNHDMPIEDDDEKYWYWKPYFNFSFNELGVKLICLAYYYKKYFLPIHLSIHNSSLGYKVFANDIKLTNTVGYIISYPSIILNNKNEIKFNGNGIHYFTKQIHYVDEYFNEFEIDEVLLNDYINNENYNLYVINDTCINIPIHFISNNINNGYFNCVLLLQKKSNNEIIYESHFSFCESDSYSYKNFIIYPKKLNTNINNNHKESRFIEYWIDNDFIIKLLVNNKWYEYNFTLKIHNPSIDFGTLSYRYYFNDHNYLISKIYNTNTYIHNILLCGKNDIDKINNKNVEQSNLIYYGDPINNVNNIPSGYKCIKLSESQFSNKHIYINWDNTDNLNDNVYVIYNHNIYDNNITIDNAVKLNNINFIDIDKLNENEIVILICPIENNPIFIDYDLYKINQFIWDNYELNGDVSWLESFDTSCELESDKSIYQYFKQNYNILSPFKQIKFINDNNKLISFNAYMHNKQLVDMNDINFDINVYDIINYHLEHNLLYIDGTLLDNSFYQYIVYEDNENNKYEIYIHNDLIGKNIYFIPKYHDKILICAYKDKNYVLIRINDNDYMISELNINEEDIICLYYDNITNQYYDINNIEKYYTLYDKLYRNTNLINSRYTSTFNLPNIMKYKNSIHLFGLYEPIENRNNILIFHNNIDMYIDGLNFKHGITKNINDDDDLKFYINGLLDTNIDSRYPDIYGLYWAHPIGNGDKPLLPIEITSLLNKFGFYVKRDYSQIYDNPNSTLKIYELDNINEFDTNEFTYYKERNEIYIGSLTYVSLEQFYINNYIESNLEDEYSNIEILLIDNEFCFYDNEIRDLNNLHKFYLNKLSYKVKFIDENNNEIIDISVNKIENKEYDKVVISFYYNKVHIVRNRFYMLSDYIQEIMQNNINIQYNITKNDKYYLNLNIDGNIYKTELIEFNTLYEYVDQEYMHLISNQNPSVYWYNYDKNKMESLPSYLNEIERYVYNENDSIEDIKTNLNKYVEKYWNSKRYADDSNEARYYYSNYLVKDLTGISGTFIAELETNIFNENNILRLCIEIIDNENIITYYNGDEFILNGNEQQVKCYIQLVNDFNIRFDNNYFIPKLIKITETEQRLKYNPEESGNIIKVNYFNKEFEYGDNNGEFVYNLYKDFFELKFNIYDIYFEGNELKTKLLNNIYECINSLKLDTYLNYDFYLMHDNEYWYALYISQETCNKIQTLDDLRLKDKDKKLYVFNEFNKHKYILNYERSSEEYLINRLEFNSSNGFNQFKTDDIICCYLYNNDRLPFNASISSKWNIHPMSLGMSTDTSFESNGEMTILSLPKNDAKYERGYYKVTVKYSLDRDIQHQFKNTSTIKIS